MVALEVAAHRPEVSAVAATCLVDPRDIRVRARLTRFGPLGLLGGPLSWLARGRLASTTIPMSWVADLGRMSRDPGLTRLCTVDPRGGGARVPLGFLASYLRYRHVGPEQVDVPVVLLHPRQDRWTPVELSMRVVRRLKAPSSVVMLRGCGHFPVEEPGLGDFVDATVRLAGGFA